MIITGVEIAGCGRFRTGMRLRGLSAGVNVLAAPNEAGKSTLFRAIRACLFQKHNTTQREVKDLVTLDATLPVEISVSFRKDGHDYAVTKRFLRSPSAQLVRDGRIEAKGAQADEMLWDVLGLAPGSGRTLDHGAFGLLWVEQTKSFGLDLPTDAAASALNGVISAEVGGLVGGERARAVLADVTAALRAVETEGGKPRTGGSLKAALDELIAVRAEEGDVRQRLDALEDDFSALARARAALGRLRDPTLRGGYEEQLAAARAALDAARVAADRLERLDIEARGAADRCAMAEERVRSLTDIDARIAQSRARLATIAAEIASQQAEHILAEQRLSAAAREVAGLEEALMALSVEAERLDQIERALDVADRLGTWRSRRETAAGLATRLNAIAGELSGIRVTARLVAEAEQLRERLIGLQARRDAAAPRLSIALDARAGDRVRLGDAIVTADGERVLHEPTTITIAGAARITVTPPPGDAAHAAELAKVQRSLAETLAKAGVESVAQAREMLRQQQALGTERDTIAARLAETAPQGSHGQDGRALLDAEIAKAEGLIAAVLRDTGTQRLPERAEVELRRAAAREKREDLRQRRARAAALLAETTRQAGEITSRLAALRATRDVEDERLQAALAQSPDETRADQLRTLTEAAAQARDALHGAQAAAAAQRAASPPADALRQCEARVERLSQAIANHDAQVNDLEREADILEAGIRHAGAEGLGEQLASLSAARELAERRAQRETESAAALKLLRDTIQSTIDESRERYLAPVRAQLRPFLDTVFPGAELALGTDFVPAQITRDAAVEGFEALSDGTREQIAVLVRLALGRMLAADGGAPPIILDDALVFSDDERLGRMFDALTRAGENQQVIVLTCRSRAFGALGGSMLRLEAVP